MQLFPLSLLKKVRCTRHVRFLCQVAYWNEAGDVRSVGVGNIFAGNFLLFDYSKEANEVTQLVNLIIFKKSTIIPAHVSS